MKKMCESLEKQMYVTKLLLSLGVPAHLKGYHYLRSAILRSEQDIEVVSSVTKLLYPDVAREYNTSVQKVERAIRNAIEVSWMRGNIESMEEMFGFSAHSGKGRPTNSEYRQNEQTGDIPGGDLAGISPFFTGYEIKAGSHLQKAVFWCMIHAEGSAHKMWRKEAE